MCILIISTTFRKLPDKNWWKKKIIIKKRKKSQKTASELTLFFLARHQKYKRQNSVKIASK
jgi:hypothetical protein